MKCLCQKSSTGEVDQPKEDKKLIHFGWFDLVNTFQKIIQLMLAFEFHSISKFDFDSIPFMRLKNPYI